MIVRHSTSSIFWSEEQKNKMKKERESEGEKYKTWKNYASI